MADPTSVSSNPTLVVPGKWNRHLVGAGVVAIALFVVGVVLSFTVGSESKTTTSGTVQAGATTAPTTTTTTKPLPSDTVLTALLATGATLVLAGVLYTRISTIKLPGGAEIDLTTDEKQQVQEAANKTDPGSKTEFESALTQELKRKKLVRGATFLNEADIKEAIGFVTNALASKA